MNWLQLIQFILTLGPQIIAIIQAIEAAIGAGNGPIKRQLAMDIVKASVPKYDQEKVLSIAGPMIDNAVAAMNKAGKLSGEVK